MPLRAVVLDVEGTTGATAFVAARLRPYSAERFTEWVDGHRDDPDVARAVGQARALIGDPAAGTRAIVAALTGWQATDPETTPLVTLQGRIWANGFGSGDLVSHFYPDVIPALRRWHAAGRQLHVFSSWSVRAQRAWFGHSPQGNLLPLMSGFFDTGNAGPAPDTASYRRIAGQTGTAPAESVLLSGRAGALDAARAAGWHTVAVRRPGEPCRGQPAGAHLTVASFAQLDLSGGRPARTGSVTGSVTGRGHRQ